MDDKNYQDNNFAKKNQKIIGQNQNADQMQEKKQQMKKQGRSDDDMGLSGVAGQATQVDGLQDSSIIQQVHDQIGNQQLKQLQAELDREFYQDQFMTNPVINQISNIPSIQPPQKLHQIIPQQNSKRKARQSQNKTISELRFKSVSKCRNRESSLKFSLRKGLAGVEGSQAMAGSPSKNNSKGKQSGRKKGMLVPYENDHERCQFKEHSPSQQNRKDNNSYQKLHGNAAKLYYPNIEPRSKHGIFQNINQSSEVDINCKQQSSVQNKSHGNGNRNNENSTNLTNRGHITGDIKNNKITDQDCSFPQNTGTFSKKRKTTAVTNPDTIKQFKEHNLLININTGQSTIEDCVVSAKNYKKNGWPSEIPEINTKISQVSQGNKLHLGNMTTDRIRMNYKRQQALTSESVEESNKNSLRPRNQGGKTKLLSNMHKESVYVQQKLLNFDGLAHHQRGYKPKIKTSIGKREKARGGLYQTIQRSSVEKDEAQRLPSIGKSYHMSRDRATRYCTKYHSLAPFEEKQYRQFYDHRATINTSQGYSNKIAKQNISQPYSKFDRNEFFIQEASSIQAQNKNTNIQRDQNQKRSQSKLDMLSHGNYQMGLQVLSQPHKVNKRASNLNQTEYLVKDSHMTTTDFTASVLDNQNKSALESVQNSSKLNTSELVKRDIVKLNYLDKLETKFINSREGIVINQKLEETHPDAIVTYKAPDAQQQNLSLAHELSHTHETSQTLEVYSDHHVPSLTRDLMNSFQKKMQTRQVCDDLTSKGLSNNINICQDGEQDQISIKNNQNFETPDNAKDSIFRSSVNNCQDHQRGHQSKQQELNINQGVQSNPNILDDNQCGKANQEIDADEAYLTQQIQVKPSIELENSPYFKNNNQQDSFYQKSNKSRDLEMARIIKDKQNESNQFQVNTNGSNFNNQGENTAKNDKQINQPNINYQNPDQVNDQDVILSQKWLKMDSLKSNQNSGAKPSIDPFIVETEKELNPSKDKSLGMQNQFEMKDQKVCISQLYSNGSQKQQLLNKDIKVANQQQSKIDQLNVPSTNKKIQQLQSFGSNLMQDTRFSTSEQFFFKNQRSDESLDYKQIQYNQNSSMQSIEENFQVNHYKIMDSQLGTVLGGMSTELGQQRDTSQKNHDASFNHNIEPHSSGITISKPQFQAYNFSQQLNQYSPTVDEIVTDETQNTRAVIFNKSGELLQKQYKDQTRNTKMKPNQQVDTHNQQVLCQTQKDDYHCHQIVSHDSQLLPTRKTQMLKQTKVALRPNQTQKRPILQEQQSQKANFQSFSTESKVQIVIDYDKMLNSNQKLLALHCQLQYSKDSPNQVELIEQEFMRQIDLIKKKRSVSATRPAQNSQIDLSCATSARKADKLNPPNIGDLSKRTHPLNKSGQTSPENIFSSRKKKKNTLNLKQLSLYYRNIRPQDVTSRQFSPIFGDKYKEPPKIPKKEQYNDMAIKDIEKAPEDHDWADTPIYRQVFQDFTDVMSLIKSDIANQMLALVREKKQQLAERHLEAKKIKEKKAKKECMPLSDHELKYLKTNDKFHLHKQLQTLMLKLPNETQIRSWITQIKHLQNIDKTDLNFPNRQDIWDRTAECYEVLMTQMGLHGVWTSIMKEYDKKRQINYEYTLLKVLYRCSLAYRSLEKIRKIFKIIIVTRDLKYKFERQSKKKKESSRSNDSTEQLQNQSSNREELIATYCLQNSRLYHKVQQFLDDSGYFRGSLFRVSGQDLLVLTRDQVNQMKEQYQSGFQSTIPRMDSQGRLQFE